MLKICTRSEIEQLIKPDWKVLDVGSGDRPFPLATMLVDRLPGSIVTDHGKYDENPTGTIQRFGKPFVEGDLEDLPFDDAAFDFVHASHVLEHARDIEKAISELTRVAARGYIECPRAWFEMIDGNPFHNWFVDFAGEELQIRPKPKEINEFIGSRRLFDRDAKLFSEIYGGVFEANYRADQLRMFEKQVCHICVLWEHKIPYRMLPSPEFQFPQ